MVQFVVVQQQRCIQEVGCNFRYVINFVRRLLEVAYLTYNVGNLQMKSCVSLDAMRCGMVAGPVTEVGPYALTIRILEKLSSPSGVKSGVPSSMKDRSVRYMPRYGMQGGSHRCSASRITRNLPSEHTTACSLVIVDLIWQWEEMATNKNGDTISRPDTHNGPGDRLYQDAYHCALVVALVHKRVGS